MTVREEDKVTCIIQFLQRDGDQIGPPVSYTFWNTELLNIYLATLKRTQISHMLLFRSDEHRANPDLHY